MTTTPPDPRAVDLLAERLCAHWLGVGTHHGWPTPDEFGPHANRYDQIQAEFRAIARAHLVALAELTEADSPPARPIDDGVSRHTTVETTDAVASLSWRVMRGAEELRGMAAELARSYDVLRWRLTAVLVEGVRAESVGYVLVELDPDDREPHAAEAVEATLDQALLAQSHLQEGLGATWTICALTPVTPVPVAPEDE